MVRFNHKGVNVSRWKRFWRGRSAHWFECVSLIDDGVEQAGIWELTSPDRNENLFMYPLQIVKALGAANYFVVNICTVIAGSDRALKYILSARMMIILQELTVQKEALWVTLSAALPCPQVPRWVIMARARVAP